MAEAGELKVPVLAGVLLLKSARMARFLNENYPSMEISGHIWHGTTVWDQASADRNNVSSVS